MKTIDKQHSIRKFGIMTIVLFLITLSSYAQNTRCPQITRDYQPKSDAEWLEYIQCHLEPRINDSLIAKHFEEAEVVFEGRIINTIAVGTEGKRIYEIEPYTIFKGKVIKHKTLKIVANRYTGKHGGFERMPIGEWSHARNGIGIFFVKNQAKDKRLYKFINPNNAWIVYTHFISPITSEKQLKEVLYDKILQLNGAKYHKTSFFCKKKDNLETK